MERLKGQLSLFSDDCVEKEYPYLLHKKIGGCYCKIITETEFEGSKRYLVQTIKGQEFWTNRASIINYKTLKQKRYGIHGNLH